MCVCVCVSEMKREIESEREGRGDAHQCLSLSLSPPYLYQEMMLYTCAAAEGIFFKACQLFTSFYREFFINKLYL